MLRRHTGGFAVTHNDIDILGCGTKSAYTPWQPATSARSLMEPKCSASERFLVIAKVANYLGEHHGFQSAHQLEDWLKAAREVDDLLGR